MADSAPQAGGAAALDAEIAALESRGRALSAARLALFAASAAGWIAARWMPIGGAALGSAGAIGFIIALVLHERARGRESLARLRALLARESEARRASRRHERAAPPIETGASPLDRGERVHAVEPPAWRLDDHVAADLGLFDGKRSLFGFLDLTSTVFGARRLRRWLTHVLRRPDDIRRRQDAVREIAERPALRQRLLEALAALRGRALDPVPALLSSERVFGDGALIAAVAHVLGTAAAGLLAVCFIRPALFPLLILLAIVHLGIIGINVRRSNPLRDRLLLLEPILRALEALDVHLASAPATSPEWRTLAETLRAGHGPRRRLLRRLRLLALHELGVLFEPINVLVLWELRILPGTEKLVLEHRREIESAIGALAEIEALLCVSAPLVEQPDFTLPEALDGERPRVEAEAMGHPLIEADHSVRNDLALGGGAGDAGAAGAAGAVGDAGVWIITGSNMAGKSTFLKAAGSNLVLAGLGGPVCARAFRWTPLEIHSDINIRDSLDDGKSYFQVEVERVRGVLEAAAAGPMHFAIFDELFRGTNSVERLAIARALLRHLRDRGVLLLVATHDIALTDLVEREGERGMRNLHLQEQVDGTSMTFDYRLRPGPAATRNAIRVLEASGYPASIVEAARAETGAETRASPTL